MEDVSEFNPPDTDPRTAGLSNKPATGIDPSATATPPRLRILIADDHLLVREGLKLVLRQIDPEMVILEADTLNHAVALTRGNADIDLVLLDLNMPGTVGLAALDGMERNCPDARIVVISATYDMHTVQAAIRRGVLGFIPKLASKDALVSALRFVLAGGIYVPPEMLLDADGVISMEPRRPRPMALANGGQTSPEAVGLTARQIEVLYLLLEGKSNKQICRDLNLAIGTVKGHVAAVLSALAASTRAEAVAAVGRLGWNAMLIERNELRKRAS